MINQPLNLSLSGSGGAPRDEEVPGAAAAPSSDVPGVSCLPKLRTKAFNEAPSRGPSKEIVSSPQRATVSIDVREAM